MADGVSPWWVLAGVGAIGVVLVIQDRRQEMTNQPVNNQNNQNNDTIASIISGAIQGAGRLFSSNPNEGQSSVPNRPSTGNPGTQPPSSPNGSQQGGWQFSGGNNINNWQQY